MSTFDTALPAPRGLLYLAIFNRQERDKIAGDQDLRSALRSADATEWPAIFERRTGARTHATPHHIKYGDRYLESAINGIVVELARAMVGARNETLNKAAFRLGQLGVAEVEAGVILTSTALGIGLSADEIKRTIRSGVRAGVANRRGRAST